VQASATSHAPALARQVVPPATKPSPGHDALPPEQASATSQTPVLLRHVVPDA
jgi:hypothetical protein